MAERVDEVMKQQGRTRSEILREALDRYIQDYEWRELLRYGEQTAIEHGIVPSDVVTLVEEYRAEAKTES